MCGITGIAAFTPIGMEHIDLLEDATTTLQQRGPDNRSHYRDGLIGLGHARLSIIDLSTAGNQPMSDPSGRYTLVFNGEIYNYKELRQSLQNGGISFRSNSDTEVFLQLLIHKGVECLNEVNGFFAFALYDKQDQLLLLGRDRMGIKPLVYYFDENLLVFGSEMKALLAYNIPNEIDKASLFTYLQLNYTPAPGTMLSGASKLLPGHFIRINLNESVERTPPIHPEPYYTIPFNREDIIQTTPETYNNSKARLRELIIKAVEKRLVSDVPLGTFLSGGIDSSVITAAAAQLRPDLHTFSIGFKDEPHYDETEYAQSVAKKWKTNHTVFALTNDTLFEHLQGTLDYFDEPFADSSALAVNILSKYTREHVTVALSGDGADELFSGYNKHMAEYRIQHPGVTERMVGQLGPVWAKMPQSRDSKLSNLSRQLNRFSEGMKMKDRDRYWRWASIQPEEDANYLMREQMIFREQRLSDNAHTYKRRRDYLLRTIPKKSDLNDILYTDMNMVLPNDMLTKVDLMSMAHSLEVRTPFLDHELVEFVFTLPEAYKINHSMRKKILQDACREWLPDELYNRSKQGFEVPLLKWFRNELKEKIDHEWLLDDLIESQGIFNIKAVRELKTRLHSSKPGDAPATIWALIVFQNWWKKHMTDA